MNQINVKGLLNHGDGRTLKIIIEELEKAGYKVFWRLVNSVNFGVPQLRERIYFIGIRKDLVRDNIQFEFPKSVPKPDLKNYLIDTRTARPRSGQKRAGKNEGGL